MDPILEEMRRVKSAQDIKDSRFRDWTQYIIALLDAKDARIADLEDKLAAKAVKRG